ncbi:MAG: hypothetical protein QOK43_314 [Acidimicrobiaceae bacterium]|nr:hypothetical protein [Acidimicrobiaceae bacterium]
MNTSSTPISTPATRTRPIPGPSPEWQFPAFERHTLANGTNVLACHLPDRPVLDVRIVFDGGIRREEPQFAGLSSITARSLVEGTELRHGPAFNETVEHLGGRVGASTDWKGLFAAISIPVTALIPGLELLTELVATPGLRDEDVARNIRRRADETSFEQMMPQASALNAFNSAVFAPGARAAVHPHGASESVANLEPGMAKEWWNRFVGPAGSTLIVTGDLSGLDLITALEKTVGQWTGTTGEAGALGLEALATSPSTLVVDFPQGVQTNLLIGRAMPPVAYEDLAPMSAASHVIAGYFASRLITKLREEMGVTYGVFSGMQNIGGASVFFTTTSVDEPATAEATAIIVEELSTLSQTLTDDEVQRATDHMVRRSPIAYKTVGAVAMALQNLVLNGHPDDHVDRNRARLAALSASDVAEAWSRYISTDQITVVAGGPAAKITEPLRAVRPDVEVKAPELDLSKLAASIKTPDGKPIDPTQLAALLASGAAKQARAGGPGTQAESAKQADSPKQ